MQPDNEKNNLVDEFEINQTKILYQQINKISELISQVIKEKNLLYSQLNQMKATINGAENIDKIIKSIQKKVFESI